MKTADQSARVSKETRSDEGKGGILTAPLRDREFRLADDVGIMPLMEWAAASDQDVASAAGLRAVFYVLQDAVHADDWHEFKRYSREEKLDATELLEFANAALEALAGRPTEAATGSSTG
jgi:hypothetical protein